MNNCLLIGNGLNRCLEHSISWGKLLKDIANDLNVSYNENIAMPLEFERIINQYLNNNPYSNNSIYFDIKKKIGQKLKYVKPINLDLHNQIRNLNLNEIMTTNYDYLLEYVFDYYYEPDLINNKQKYLMSSTTTIDGIKFYHPHGTAMAPNTMCLGYEHYMGIVSRLRSEINTTPKQSLDMNIQRILLGNEKPKETWGEKFYTSNIGIVGLSLSDCKSDLWWLLVHRAYLYYSNYRGSKKLINNKIVYYDIFDNIKKNAPKEEQQRITNYINQLNRHTLLMNENVEVVAYDISEFDGSYKDAYLKIFDRIKNNGID